MGDCAMSSQECEIVGEGGYIDPCAWGTIRFESGQLEGGLSVFNSSPAAIRLWQGERHLAGGDIVEIGMGKLPINLSSSTVVGDCRFKGRSIMAYVPSLAINDYSGSPSLLFLVPAHSFITTRIVGSAVRVLVILGGCTNPQIVPAIIKGVVVLVINKHIWRGIGDYSVHQDNCLSVFFGRVWLRSGCVPTAVTGTRGTPFPLHQPIKILVVNQRNLSASKRYFFHRDTPKAKRSDVLLVLLSPIEYARAFYLIMPVDRFRATNSIGDRCNFTPLPRVGQVFYSGLMG